ncbi:MAG TPA: PASTA domain-containing protein [Kofleriaceae bacterium]|nr:PASTA domain-containing protein [Kofleriaceae bacterium]
MELKPFVAKLVNPGEPLTAQAWNDLVTAIDDTHKFLVATTHVVRVRVTNTDLDPRTVRVTASRSDGAPIEAVRPIAGDTHHVLAELEVGAYTVRAEAAGFADATATVTIGDQPEQEITMQLAKARPIMPNVFGKALADAMTQIQQAGIVISNMFDFLGNPITPASPGARAASALVLVQQPAAGTPVDPTIGAQLVVAVPPEVEQAIVMPSLIGLTESEARNTLEQLGLVVGRVKIVST